MEIRNTRPTAAADGETPAHAPAYTPLQQTMHRRDDFQTPARIPADFGSEGDERAFMAAVGVEVRLPRRQLVSMSPAAPALVSINGDDFGGVVDRNSSETLFSRSVSVAWAVRSSIARHYTPARKQRGRIIDRLRKVAMQRGRVELGLLLSHARVIADSSCTRAVPTPSAYVSRPRS